MSDLIFLYVAYTIIWGGLFAYALMMHMGQRQLRKELDALKEALDARRNEK